ncbi:hypothetical protein CRG98_035386 [Punica granatum]|uniref:Reverse transcriptase Ty1/copia-type domain-containing protein n=1 Tax=Punica granatum TaxID=22663 RepID=A0A2I0IJN9_PUNGR|nr:hypothetical protein CRG98_035386 [Punica granatum]
MTKAPFTGKGERANDFLALIHTDVTQEPCRSGMIRCEPERYGFLVTQDNDVLLIDNDEPKTYAEAVIGPYFEKWLEAMRSKMDSMYTNQVWTLVDPPEGVKPIGCKWVFKKKTDMDDNVITFKGRLVEKGFTQVHGVDCDKTFSLVAMLKSIRILLAIAAYYDYEIRQMDVKTAFLNETLLEDVYMTQPEGFSDPQSAGKVYTLQRSIYELKQASRSWIFVLMMQLKSLASLRMKMNPVFTRRHACARLRNAAWECPPSRGRATDAGEKESPLTIYNPKVEGR